MTATTDAMKEFFEQRLPQLVGEEMASGSTDRAGKAMAIYALMNGPTGFMFRVQQKDWHSALDIVNVGIDSTLEKNGSYNSWSEQEKSQYGYVLAFFYFLQSMCLAENSRIDEALNGSLRKALEIREITPVLRSAILEAKRELSSLR